MHGGLSPDLQSMEQIRRVMRPTDVPDTGALLFFVYPSFLMFSPQASYAISYGQTPIKILRAGRKTTEECRLLLVQMWFRVSFRNMTWILSAELTRLGFYDW